MECGTVVLVLPDSLSWTKKEYFKLGVLYFWIVAITKIEYGRDREKNKILQICNHANYGFNYNFSFGIIRFVIIKGFF